MRGAHLAIQVVPLGGAVDREAIEISIRCIRESGFKCGVGPMKTTTEGYSSDKLLRAALADHREVVSTDLKAVQANIRLLECSAGLDALGVCVVPYMESSNR